MSGKSIVIYFSHTGENYDVGNITVGNTAKVAAELVAQTGADVWEIKEADAYPEKYTLCIERAKKELHAKARPEYVGDAPDLSQYDLVFLGYPNWWGDAPMVVYTFLESVNTDGKTILPFCTHEGTGLGATARYLAKAFPNAKIETKGFEMFGHVAQNEPEEVTAAVSKWLEALGIGKKEAM